MELPSQDDDMELLRRVPYRCWRACRTQDACILRHREYNELFHSPDPVVMPVNGCRHCARVHDERQYRDGWQAEPAGATKCPSHPSNRRSPFLHYYHPYHNAI